ncbi:MAG: hypothetical protein SVN78_01360 [Deferribacterota bacterium]|nr:hypothetical protein [Deferribacterota bacterium]
MKYLGRFIIIMVFAMFTLSLNILYAQTIELSEDNPYKGERIRILGTGWKPYEKIIIELTEHGPKRSGMVLKKCGEAFAYEDGTFGGSCLIPPDLEYSTADIYVNGLEADSYLRIR